MVNHEIMSAKLEDAGLYFCSAENYRGTTELPMYLTVGGMFVIFIFVIISTAYKLTMYGHLETYRFISYKCSGLHVMDIYNQHYIQGSSS